MKRIVALMCGVFLFAGCAGGGSIPPGTTAVPSAAGSGAQLEPYQIPIVSDPAVESAAKAGSSGRQILNGYCGTPVAFPNVAGQTCGASAAGGSSESQTFSGSRQTENGYGGIPAPLPPHQLAPCISISTGGSGTGRTTFGSRLPLNGYGGVPGFASIIDATNLPAGSQVNLAIAAVNAIAGGVAYPIVQFSPEVVINVLNYQTQALALGSATIPAIHYDGVQYVIDPAQSSVVTNGQTYPMQFGTFVNRAFAPSPAGLTALYFPAPVDATTTSPNFVVDFNVAQWINLAPSPAPGPPAPPGPAGPPAPPAPGGTAQVGPQWGGTVWAQSAVIAGTIVNAAGQPVSGATITASAGGSVVQATISHPDGSFQLHAIPSGSYSLQVYNTYAPPTTDFTLTASGNDPVGASISGPSISVPSGYLINVGSIQD